MLVLFNLTQLILLLLVTNIPLSSGYGLTTLLVHLIFLWVKSDLQPLTITIVRFSTLNSKTRHLAPSNYRNRAKKHP